MSRAKYWSLTINNYNERDVEKLRSMVENDENCEHVIFGYEVGENGTPHLQVHISLKNRVRFQIIKNQFPNAHISVTRQLGNAIDYCKKEGNFEEIGCLTTNANAKGKRNDLEEFKNSVKQEPRLTLTQLRELHSEVFAKYPRFCTDYYMDNQPNHQVEAFPLRLWQQKLNSELLKPPDKRQIIFIVDKRGDMGKSWFAHYYCQLHDNAQVILPGKKADMCYVLRTDIRVLFVDAPRSKQGEYLQYDFLEDVKNGFVFSPKYESRVKHLPPCHVVVNMNEVPDMQKLSEDRYKIVILKEGDKTSV
jgi:Putative viral replication protein